jgi:hypothetical protein
MKDRFTTDTWYMQEVKFVRDNAGRLTGATFGGDRIGPARFPYADNAQPTLSIPMRVDCRRLGCRLPRIGAA